jgi:hypothetical protein
MSPYSRGAFRPSSAHFFTLYKERGRREDRVAACTRGPRAKNCAKSALTTGTGGISPASPAQWFYNLYVLSPVNQLMPPSFALRLKGVAEFSACMGAPGPHDFAVRVCAARQPAHPRPPHSAPRFVTTRNAPHDGAEWKHLSTIPKKRKKNLIAWRLATRIGLTRLTKLPASRNHVFRAFGMREPLSLPEVAPIRPTGKMAEIEPTHD